LLLYSNDITGRFWQAFGQLPWWAAGKPRQGRCRADALQRQQQRQPSRNSSPSHQKSTSSVPWAVRGAPAFEGKPVILAERTNGQPLGAGHFRIVVPGDRRGGRSVRDVASIAVMSPVPH